MDIGLWVCMEYLLKDILRAGGSSVMSLALGWLISRLLGIEDMRSLEMLPCR